MPSLTKACSTWLSIGNVSPAIAASRAATALQEPAEHGVAAVVQINERHHLLHRLAAQRLRIHPQQPHHVGAPREQIALRLGVKQVQGAALAHHRIEIQRALESLPQLQRVLVEADIVRLEIVGTDDGRVTPHVAQPDRALLEHRYVADAVLGGEVEGGRQSMTAAADDYDAVAGARYRLRPGARPPALAGETLEKQSPARIAAARHALGTRYRIHRCLPS